MEKNKIILDDEAEQLFRELEGLDSARDLESFSEIADLLSDCLQAEEERLDKWRVHLVEAAHLISSFFVDARFLDGVKKKKNAFPDLIKIFSELSDAPKAKGSILVRFRGQPKGGRIVPKLDYLVICGSVVIDSSIVQAMLNRMGLRMSHLAGRSNRAFEVFSEQGVSTLYVEFPGKDPSRMGLLEEALQIVSRFNFAVNSGKPIVYESKGKQKVLMPIRDEYGVPEPNLTILAALNNLNPDLMKKLIAKVHNWMQSSSEGQDDRHAGMYDAILSVPALKKKLIRPPLEINNVKWLVKDHESQKISREKAIVARHVMNRVSGPSEKKRKVLQSVYGDDYRKIDSLDFGERIGHISELISSLEKDNADVRVQKEVMDNLRSRFEEVREEVFDDLFIAGGAIKIRSRGQETIVEKVNEKLKNMVSFFKRRTGAQKKIKSIMHQTMDFTEEDYENIAMDFEIPIEDAKKIMSLLKSCFEEDKRFKRSEFEKHVSEFVKFENKVFNIMWHFLKATQTRKDRVAFLNSLQFLIARMNHPENALKVLIGDICQDPDIIAYSDRNSFMLAILLLRTYNQELRLDIEITPEEVLEVRKGINDKAVTEVAEMIDSEQEAVLTKIRTIHGKLLESIFGDGNKDGAFPFRFLLSLEREACIFLSLVQGETAGAVLRSAVKGYGDPSSDIYSLQKDPEYIQTILQHLKVMVRALGRLEDPETMELFNKIRRKEARFYELGDGSQHESVVRSVMEHVQKTRRVIYKKSQGQ